MLAFRLRSVSRKSSSPPEFTLQGVVAEIGVEVNYPETHKVSKQESGIIGNISVNVVVPTTHNISITQQAIIGELTLVEPAPIPIESVSTSSIVEEVSWEDMRYTLNLTVYDSLTSNPIEGATLTISIDDSTQITDALGQVTFTNVVGYTNFTIVPTHPSYPEQKIVWTFNLQGQLGEANKTIDDAIYMDIPAEIPDPDIEQASTEPTVSMIFFDDFHYNLRLTLTDFEGNPFEGITATHGEQSGVSDVNGVVFLYDLEGYINQTVNLSYDIYSDTFTLQNFQQTDYTKGKDVWIDYQFNYIGRVNPSDEQTSTEPTVTDIAWEDMRYTLNLTVYDSLTSDPIEGATLTISTDGSTQITDSLGQATFTNVVGYTNFTIVPSHASYPEQKIVWTFNLQGQLGEANKTIDDVMYMDIPAEMPDADVEQTSTEPTVTNITWEETFTMSFKVVDETEADLEGASVSITGTESRSGTTDVNGEISWSGLTSGEYNFSVSNTGYPTVTSEESVNLIENKLITINMGTETPPIVYP